MLAMAEPIERLMLFCSLLRGISANYTRARRGVLLEIGRRSEDEVRREMQREASGRCGARTRRGTACFRKPLRNVGGNGAPRGRRLMMRRGRTDARMRLLETALRHDLVGSPSLAGVARHDLIGTSALAGVAWKDFV